MKNLLLLIFALVAFTVSTAAQEPSGTTEPTLIKLPKAVNPKDGYPGGGPVAVRVTVNEKGEVTDAEFVSGPGPVCEAITRPDVLRTREAAVEIVRQAKFTPATSGGQPIPATTLVSIDLVSTAEQWEKAVGERSFSVTDFPPPPIGGSTPKNDVEKNPAPKENYEMRADSTTIVAANDARECCPGNSGRGPLPGSLLSKAIKLGKPIYPAAARAVRASGAVQVQVLIGTDGNVLTARAAGGHPLLRSAAVNAACSSKFQPTLLEGQPVKVSGILTYNFVP